MSAEDLAAAQRRFAERTTCTCSLVKAAGSIFTSGQFFGLVLVMLLGILVITNEFQYQTATATFLTTPHRTPGRRSASWSPRSGWACCSGSSPRSSRSVGGLLFFHNIGLTNSLGEWPVQRAMLFNAGRVPAVGGLRLRAGHPDPQPDRLGRHRHGRLSGRVTSAASACSS